jgi:hypothetical protein
MLFYSLNTDERAQHLRIHYLGCLPPARKYCSLCYPLNPNIYNNLDTVNPRFNNFWLWISQRYSARRFNNYSLQIFDTIEESLQRGDLQSCENLIQSIEFQEFWISEVALVFFTARLFVTTNRFEIPTTY